MKKYLDWIVAHKALTGLIVFGLFLVPLVVTHLLYKWTTPNYMLQSSWNSGELITYIAGFEAFVGTVFLGIVAVRQNEKANELNELMLENEERHRKFERQPCVMITGATKKKQSIADKNLFVTLTFTNAANIYTQFYCTDISFGEKFFSVSKVYPIGEGVSQKDPVSQLAPYESREIPFQSLSGDVPTDLDSSCKIRLFLLNSIGEQFLETISFTFNFEEGDSLSLSKFSYVIEKAL